MIQFDGILEMEKASGAICHLDPSCDRDTWVRIGMALHELGDAGRDLWHQWSKRSDKYDERAANSVWQSFSAGTGGVGIATLYHMAKQNGWDGKSVDAGAISQSPVETLPLKNKRSNGSPHAKRPPIVYPSLEEAAQAIVSRIKRDERFKGCDSYRTRIFPYRSASGDVVAGSIRVDYFDASNRPAKEFRQVRAVDGGFVLEGMESSRPLYHLPDVTPAGTVIIVEGEKATDALVDVLAAIDGPRPDIAITTSLGGAQAPSKTDWSPLAGKQVFLWPDNDEAGSKYVSKIASILSGLTTPPEVRLLHVDGMPEKGDAFDWIGGFGDAAEPESILAELLGLLDRSTAIEAVEEAGGIRYETLGLLDLLSYDDTLDFLIPGVMVADENMLIGAAEKTLKSSIGMDLVLSLASGTPFLGEFAVPQAVPVGIMSGESGKKSLASLARRIVAARSIDAEFANQNFIFTSDLPALDDADHAAALLRFVERHKLRALLIDPMYLCFEASSDDPHNHKKLGPLLRRIAEPCQHMRCTIILVEHALRMPQTGQALTIQQLPTTASKFARQFMLLSRRTEYQDDGRHELWMRVGGSAGHTGCWGVDVNEGTIDQGRKWDVNVVNRGEAVEASREAREEAAAQRRQKKQAAEEELVRESILAAFRSLGGKPETKANLSALAGHRGKTFESVLGELLRTKRVSQTTVERSNGQSYAGFALAKDTD